jgi:hypothetical protein
VWAMYACSTLKCGNIQEFSPTLSSVDFATTATVRQLLEKRSWFCGCLPNLRRVSALGPESRWSKWCRRKLATSEPSPRIGLLAGEIAVPEDFDRMGRGQIENLFEGGT